MKVIRYIFICDVSKVPLLDSFSFSKQTVRNTEEYDKKVVSGLSKLSESIGWICMGQIRWHLGEICLTSVIKW